MLVHIMFLVFVLYTSAVSKNDPFIDFPRRNKTSVADYFKMNSQQAFQMSQILRYAGYDSMPNSDYLRVSRRTNSAIDPALEKYRQDFSALGSQEMILQGRVFHFQNDFIANGTLLSPGFIPRLGKRNQAHFQVDYRDGKRPVWGTPLLMENICASGLNFNGKKANFIHWWVRGRLCKFVLFEDNWCIGKIIYDTEDYNVVSDGFQYKEGFQSVFFRCQ